MFTVVVGVTGGPRCAQMTAGAQDVHVGAAQHKHCILAIRMVIGVTGGSVGGGGVAASAESCARPQSI